MVLVHRFGGTGMAAASSTRPTPLAPAPQRVLDAPHWLAAPHRRLRTAGTCPEQARQLTAATGDADAWLGTGADGPASRNGRDGGPRIFVGMVHGYDVARLPVLRV